MDALPAELELSVGDSSELVLPGLGTAGYRWDGEVLGDAGVVALAWQRGWPPGEPAVHPPGAGAPERLTVAALAPGRVVVRLVQRRPWESGPPLAEHTVSVAVAGP